MLKALKWTSRKVLALLVTALGVGIYFALTEPPGGNGFLGSVLFSGFFAVYFGGIPALVTTGISDALSVRLSKHPQHRFPTALLIHVLGGFSIMFILLGFPIHLSGNDWSFVWLSMGAALGFFFMDEGLKRKRWLVN